MSVLQKVENIAVIGLLAGALLMAYRYLNPASEPSEEGQSKQYDPCAGMSGLPQIGCEFGKWFTGYQYTEDSKVTTIDEHGCSKGIMEWCGQLNACIPIGTTCPRPARPYEPIYEFDKNGCKIGLETHCEVLDKCLDNKVYSENFCVIHEDPDDAPIKQIGDRCFKGSKVLNVPPGMSCSDAVEDMCRRFGPDSGWC